MDESDYDIYGDLGDFDLSEQLKEVCDFRVIQTARTICIQRPNAGHSSISEKYCHLGAGEEIAPDGRDHRKARTRKENP